MLRGLLQARGWSAAAAAAAAAARHVDRLLLQTNLTMAVVRLLHENSFWKFERSAGGEAATGGQPPGSSNSSKPEARDPKAIPENTIVF